MRIAQLDVYLVVHDLVHWGKTEFSVLGSWELLEHLQICSWLWASFRDMRELLGSLRDIHICYRKGAQFAIVALFLFA